MDERLTRDLMMPALTILAALLVAAAVVTLAVARLGWQPSFVAGVLPEPSSWCSPASPP